MKPFQQYLEEAELELSSIEVIELMKEDSAPVSTTTDGVANPDAKPIFKKDSHFGHPCICVDEDTYGRCVQGKQPFERWVRYVDDDNLRNEMQRMFYRNKRMLVKNEKTGGMVFIK